MRSWKRKLSISFILLAMMSNSSFAIDDLREILPANTPKLNPTGGVEIPIGDAPLIRKKTPMKMNIVSDHIQYFPEEKKVVAYGNASVVIKGQDAKLKAKKITMYQTSNEIFAEGDVKIVRSDMTMTGDYIKIDLNKKNVMISNPFTEVKTIKLQAKEAYVYAEDIEAVKGTAHLKEEMHFILASSAFLSGFETEDYQKMIRTTDTKAYKEKIQGKTYRIKTSEIELAAGKERHFIKMKNATIYKGKWKLATAPIIVISSDKNFAQVETMLPEFGHNDQVGKYFGPAALFNLPFATSLKLAPLLVYDSSWGYGAFARIRNSYNKTEVIYGSDTNNFIIDGEQKLWDERVKLYYSKNAYVRDGFMGQKMPGHLVSIDYNDSINFRDLKMIYEPRFSIGVAADSTKDRRIIYSPHKKGFSTLRLKAQGTAYRSTPLFRNDYIDMNIFTNYDFTQYGTGENVAVIRTGPEMKYKSNDLMLRAGYYIAGMHGQSPFIWDNYYYGHETAILGAQYKFNQRVSFGISSILNLNKDNWDSRLLAENKLYAKIGPDDFKFCFAYDTVRRRTMMGLNLLVGSEKSDIEFEKFKIKDFKHLEKNKKEETL